MVDHLHVITGGPGSGKTSRIEALAGAGIRHMPEAGRSIIQDQVDICGTALPWDNREAFSASMLGWEMRPDREAVNASGPIIFDRGIPDVSGYAGCSRQLRRCGRPSSGAMQRRVFIAPPWPAIFEQDAERRQTLEEAENTYQAMVDAYSGLDYELVSRPLASIADRVELVRELIG